LGQPVDFYAVNEDEDGKDSEGNGQRITSSSCYIY